MSVYIKTLWIYVMFCVKSKSIFSECQSIAGIGRDAVPFLKPIFSLCLGLEPGPGCITIFTSLPIVGELKSSQRKIINE